MLGKAQGWSLKQMEVKENKEDKLLPINLTGFKNLLDSGMSLFIHGNGEKWEDGLLCGILI